LRLPALLLEERREAENEKRRGHLRGLVELLWSRRISQGGRATSPRGSSASTPVSGIKIPRVPNRG
jgi:hypothetical protein